MGEKKYSYSHWALDGCEGSASAQYLSKQKTGWAPNRCRLLELRKILLHCQD
jgi:hypothetical protein